MYAKLSAENRIQEKMRALEISNDFLAVMAGIPSSRLSLAFRGIKPLSNADGEHLLHLLNQLSQLADRVAPVPVAFKNPLLIKTLLNEDQARVGLSAGDL